MPTFLVGTFVFLGVLAVISLIIGGTAWLDYSRFIKATGAHEGNSVQATSKKGMAARIPGSSNIFWWLATKHAGTELSVAANEDPDSEAVDLSVKTYKDTPDLINEIILPKSTSAVEQYQNMILDEQIAGAYLAIGLAMRPENLDLVAGKETFDILVASRTAFALAKKVAEQEYGSAEAADLYEQVAEIDAENYAIAQNEIPRLRLIAADEMQTWTLPVKHFTVNPLLAFPYMTPLDYANDYITVPEFKAVLEQLFKNGYILVGLDTLYKVDEETGSVSRVNPSIPRGKKPLVLSIENLNYSTRLSRQGMVDKLIIDKEGKIGTWTSAYNADMDKDVTSFDNDVIPILDAFIEEHPIFSWRGARATIAVTGYRGVFGYQTSQGSENHKGEVKEAKKIATALRERGYTFASLGYNYNIKPGL
jgi:hypothetical protein